MINNKDNNNSQYFNSHAHVERDSVQGKYLRIVGNFNSHAHVERDGLFRERLGQLVISTHTLTWSVTIGSL